MTTVNQAINNAATLQNAIEWNQTAEQFIYCIDLLEISAHCTTADSKVDRLESLFMALLVEDGGHGWKAIDL